MRTDKALSTADSPGGYARDMPRGRAAERLIYAEVLDYLRMLHTSMTAAMERFQGQPLNHVLRVETFVFPASGYYGVNFGTPIGCVQVRNPGAHAVTVTSTGQVTPAPTTGVGLFIVSAASKDMVSLGSTIVSFYGTPGDSVSYQAFSTGATPGAT